MNLTPFIPALLNEPDPFYSKGHGKSGGARVIYYHFVSASRIGLLFVYPKNEQVNLTPAQKVVLRKIIEQWR